MKDILEAAKRLLGTAGERSGATAIVLMVLGIALMIVPFVTVTAAKWSLSGSRAPIVVFLLLGGVLILAGVFVVIYSVSEHSQGREKAKEQFRRAMDARDLEGAAVVLRKEAIRKLKHGDVTEAILGAQEIAEHGATTPFEEGFRALCHELKRRRSWALRFEIVEALGRITGPLRATKIEDRGGFNNDA
jgi:hypothetical protein